MDYFLTKKEAITPSLINIYNDLSRILSSIDTILITSTNEREINTPILLRCECFKKNPQAKFLFGCTDKHFFDIVTPIYFTLGVLCPFYPVILILIKLIRTCGAMNETLYSPDMCSTYGKQRKHQTLINMLGDIAGFVLGHIFYCTISWPFLIPIILLVNLFASREGGDIISMICWCMDKCGYSQRRKRYINSSSLEKFSKKC